MRLWLNGRAATSNIVNDAGSNPVRRSNRKELFMEEEMWELLTVPIKAKHIKP